MSGRDSFQP